MTPQELFELALSYYNGTDNIPQDYLKAYGLFLEAAEAGHIESQSYLGRMLSMGEGVEKNYDEAVKWLKFAAEAGDADAQNRLGVRYQFGQGVEQNYSEAVRWFKLAAMQGFSKAQSNLVSIYLNSLNGEYNIQDFSELEKWLRISAEEGNPVSQFNLALLYDNGDVVEQNLEEAFKWYSIAAEQGEINSQYQLGYMYSYGHGVKVDHTLALKWFLKAYEGGDEDAAYSIGWKYEHGEGVEQDHTEAIKWYKIAADYGDIEAQLHIALKYNNGDGVERNIEEAIKWYKLAYQNGSIHAANNLGFIYKFTDTEEALKWFRLAAENKSTLAQYNLGTMYRDGLGVDKNLDEALKWLKLSADGGEACACNDLAVLYAASGEKQNFLEARKYYYRAIEKGASYALANVASLWQDGSGIEQNPHEAIRLYRSNYYGNKSVFSLLRLAECYLFGHTGVNCNYKKAVDLLKKAYRRGYKLVCYNLGCAYFNGQGVPQNKDIAYKYWQKVRHIDDRAEKALSGAEAPFFQPFSVNNISRESPFFSERCLMFNDNNIQYINDCEEKASNGDLDAMFILSQRLTRDNRKAEYYFKQAIKGGHHIAVYLDKVHSERKSFKDIKFTTPFYLDEIVESEYEILSDDVSLSIVFLIYLLLKGYTIDKYPDNVLLSKANSIYQNQITEENHNKKFSRIYNLCSSRSHTELLEEYKEYLLGILKADLEDTTRYPSKWVFDIIIKYLSFGNSIINTIDLLGGGASYMLYSNEKVTLNVFAPIQKDQFLYYIFSNISDGKNALLFNEEFPDSTHADAVIAIPELRRCPGYNFDLYHDQVEYINNILENQSTYKKAVILVDKEFCSCIHTEMYEIRKHLFLNKFVERVVEFPKDSFNDVKSSTALLFLNFEKEIEKVIFEYKNSTTEVSLQTLEQYDFCINSQLYCQTISIPEGYIEYRLLDLITINQSCCLYNKPNKYLNTSSLSSSLSSSLKSMQQHRNLCAQATSYKGPLLFVKYDDQLKLYFYRENDYIACDSSIYAVNVNQEIVAIEYIAKLLLDSTISEYIAEITDSDGNFMPRDLLYKKVAIPIDKSIQKQIVEEDIIKERQKSSSGVEYNVVLLTRETELLQNHFGANNINIFQKLSSVNNEEYTFEDLYKEYIEDPSKSLIDAIIIDSDIEDYEDVLFYFRTIRERNIQIYFIGDIDEIRIAGSKLKEYFLKENRIFDQTSEGYLDKLLNKMRDDLDSSNAPQAKIRNKYKAVFEASDALDKKYPDIGISKTVLRYIQTGCNIDDVDNVSGPCGSFRNVCHKLLQVLVSKKLVPDIDPGAIPAMLRDGRFYDGKTQRTYILKEQFMSKYLSRALEYFCKVTNEGVHGSQDSSRLGTAALNILMEFIVWFYENDICSNKLDDIPVNPCYEDITDKLPTLKGKVCTVKAQGAGKDRYLYADNIHIKENKSLKPGMKIKIKDVGAEMIAEDDRRKINDEYMVFYTSNYEIL